MIIQKMRNISQWSRNSYSWALRVVSEITNFSGPKKAKKFKQLIFRRIQ